MVVVVEVIDGYSNKSVGGGGIVEFEYLVFVWIEIVEL